MNSLMAKYFYDKTVEFYTYKEIPSSEGGRPKKSQRVTKGSIQCNIQPTANRILKEKYGLDLDASYLITCDPQEEVAKQWNFEWNGVEMEVVETLKYDSHLLILCQ
ncbi:hypothetical protein ERUR111494_02555 [Erysipelothrix urinaevulpis]|uniref:hypothetical protein n=1 Tax=Erysipelothrix urinaevulpis TaxID=2683717 RepID=UPI00135BBE65|nr:hypothetical protein [Erysipelothrix urinaevulpis]